MERHETTTYDIAAEINRRPLGSQQILLFLVCGLIMLFDGFDIQVVSFTAPLLADHVGTKVAAFGPIFASGLLGLTLGSLAVGPVADRYGRKSLVLLSALIFGLFTVLTGYAESVRALILIRFLSGIGLGGGIPNAVALVAEYAPESVRTRIVGIAVSATPLGAALGGLACWTLIGRLGWQSVYWVGGAVPIILCIALGWWLPESIRFMVAAGRNPERIAALLRRIAPDFRYQSGGQFVSGGTIHKGVAVRQLFTGGNAPRTLLLWLSYFMVFLMSFLLSSWLPSVLKLAGLGLSQAIVALMLFNLGGVAGAVLLGRLIRRFSIYHVLGAAFVLSALSVNALSHMEGIYNWILLVIFVVGICVQGSICILYALTSSLYPTAIRVTGVGWAVGAGRFGAIFGPLIGGALLQADWGMSGLFGFVSVPALVAAGAMLCLKGFAVSGPERELPVEAVMGDAYVTEALGGTRLEC